MLFGGLAEEAADRYLHCFIGKIIATLCPGAELLEDGREVTERVAVRFLCLEVRGEKREEKP